ncbi:hypothetical protein QJQ45_028330 [Haematococcus lacustris]|nr:hypothetical protein QJQ45_028330 [Haematococcus lacustris]
MRVLANSCGSKLWVPLCAGPPATEVRTPRRLRHHALAATAPGGPVANGVVPTSEPSWSPSAVPSYLQNTQRRPYPCDEGPPPTFNGTKAQWKREGSLWQCIRREAAADAASEPMLSSYLYASVLAHNSFHRALSFVLANRLSNPTLLATQLFEIFLEVLSNDDDVRCGALADVEAIRDRDPACISLVQALLYYKGYQAIQTHRIAHALWCRGQRVMAMAMQSRSSEVFGVDIHPAARIGKSILLDHGTGVVIGETAVIGDGCSLLQGVTLGGTGKEAGDRHPKIGPNVLIGANASVLGNISVGQGVQIAAGSLVLKPVPEFTLVAGSPARHIGKVEGIPAQTMTQWSDCLPCADPEPPPGPLASPAPGPASPALMLNMDSLSRALSQAAGQAQGQGQGQVEAVEQRAAGVGPLLSEPEASVREQPMPRHSSSPPPHSATTAAAAGQQNQGAAASSPRTAPPASSPAASSSSAQASRAPPDAHQGSAPPPPVPLQLPDPLGSGGDGI